MTDIDAVAEAIYNAYPYRPVMPWADMPDKYRDRTWNGERAG